ncbi:MAG: 3-phosphoshikimate 1-carboxyvinyltransferase, partial [Plesiomonas shigelloides]
MESLTLQPIQRVSGTVNLPGSKSVSNRALLLAALARGTTRLTNLLDSDDVRHMLNALSALGVSYRLSADRTVCEVDGLGQAFTVPASPDNSPLTLFLGNA